MKSNSACLDNINVRSPASSGRFDVVLDFVLECLFDRYGPRDDVTVMAVLDGCSPTKIIEVSSSTVKYKIESESEILDLILKSQVVVKEESFEKLLCRLRREGYVIMCLHEQGTPLRSLNPRELLHEKIAFVIGDQDGFTSRDEQILHKTNVKFISIGPVSYLSWFCCVYMNYVLDMYCRDYGY